MVERERVRGSSSCRAEITVSKNIKHPSRLNSNNTLIVIMKLLLLFLFTFILIVDLTGQNISIDRLKREIIGSEIQGDSLFILTKSKVKGKEIYPSFYVKDTVTRQGITYFDKADFKPDISSVFETGKKPEIAVQKLKKAADIKLKKVYKMKIGMMPVTGNFYNKRRPGKYKLVGYELIVSAEAGKCYEGMVFYSIQKHSFFKRFFKKFRLKRNLKRLPVFLINGEKQVIFKNDMVQEGGHMHENLISFKVKSETGK